MEFNKRKRHQNNTGEAKALTKKYVLASIPDSA
jgi:hypothetical protein